MDAVRKSIEAVPGTVGVAAKHFESGEELALDAEGVFHTASTFKVPILAELYRQIDEGIIDPGSRVVLSDDLRAPGSGVLKEMGAELQPAVHDLAMLMIIVSDNTATDLVYHMVRREKLNATMQDWGLTNTRLPFSCRELLYSMFGVDTDDIAQGNAIVAERLAKQEVLADSAGLSEDHGDVSTPAEMVRLLEIIYRGEKHTPRSRDAMMDVLLRQQATSIIPAELPPGTAIAHKTGGVPSVRCDVGMVFSPSGPYAVAIMAKEVTDTKAVDRRLARVSRTVYDVFNP